MANLPEYIFPQGSGQKGLDSLRIKNAIVDSFLPTKINNIVNNQLKNPGFYETVARALATTAIRNEVDRRREKQKGVIKYDDAFRDQSFNSGRNSPENTPNQTGLSDENKGLLASANIIPNLTLVSNYTPINFFEGRGEPTEEISIDVPLCSISYSYSNKYAESTPIGYNGTIKELMGTSNLSIKIEGVFVGKYLNRANEDVYENMPNMQNFQLMCMRNKIVSVNSLFIQENTILNDYFKDCVIKNFSLPQDNTQKNIQRFSITLESDKPLNITE